MDLLSVVIIIAIVGVLVWLLNQAPFIDARFKTIFTYVAIVAVVLWLLSLFVSPHLSTIRVGR